MSEQTSQPTRRPLAAPGTSAFARVADTATAGRVLFVLVTVAVVWRAAAALDVAVPWIVPDEPAYALLGRGFWQDGSLSILGGPTPYLGVLYPVLAGIPLELGGLGTGYDVLRVLQSIVVCSTAVVVYFWARSLVRPWWALAAAGLALLLPGLAYAGTIAPDALLLPLVTLTGWQTVRTLEAPTRLNQALLVGAVLACVLTRSEAFVVAIAVVAGAAVRGRWRELVPVWIAFAATAVVWLALGGRSPLRSLGGYPDSDGYTLLRIVELVAEHAGLLVLVSGIVPLCAVVLLALTRPAEPAVRSSLAVILTLAVASVLEIGVFAAGHADRLVERGLLFALPSLLVGFAVWLGSGAPRPRGRTLSVAAVAFAGLIALPVGALAAPDAVPDNPSLVPLIDVSSPHAYALTALAASMACALLVWLPRRFLWLLPVVLGAVFLAVSVSASREFADRSRVVQHTLVGNPPNGIDRTADGPVAFLYDGDRAWSLPWLEALWNTRVRQVIDVTATRVPGPLPQSQLRLLGDDGGLRLVDGSRPSAPVLVAPEGMQLAGRVLARKPGVGDVPGLVLWQVLDPPRVATWEQGVLPSGDIGPGGTATLDVYNCRSGAFHLVAIGRDNTRLTLARDGTTVSTTDLWPRGVWSADHSRRRPATAAARSRSRPARSCTCSSSNGRPRAERRARLRRPRARGRVQRLRREVGARPDRVHREPRRLVGGLGHGRRRRTRHAAHAARAARHRRARQRQ